MIQSAEVLAKTLGARSLLVRYTSDVLSKASGSIHEHKLSGVSILL